jgi:tetratricopeptide (TPR) repeat protein
VRRHLALAACLAAVAGGCATARHGAALAEPELLLEVLPRHAAVKLDGAPLGAGDRTVRAPPPGHHWIAVVADGFEPAEVVLAEGPLGGARVGVALRPAGLDSAGQVDFDEPGGLALAAAALTRSGRHQDALDYAARALVLDAALPLAWRVRGDAQAGLGHRAEARAAWGRYLELQPAAPDRAAVEARLIDDRAGFDLPGDRSR